MYIIRMYIYIVSRSIIFPWIGYVRMSCSSGTLQDQCSVPEEAQVVEILKL